MRPLLAALCLFLTTGCDGWSPIYRFFNDSQYDWVELDTYESFEALATVMKQQEWIEDGHGTLGQSVQSPHRLQWKIDRHEQGFGDCDDFAAYETAVLNKSVREGVFKDLTFDHADMLSVFWEAEDGSKHGHAVTLLDFKNGTWSYMDYGMPSRPVDSKRAVVDQVVAAYKGTKVLYWLVSNESLFLLEFHLQ